MKRSFALLTLFVLTISAVAQREHGVRPTETGGPLMFEQAAFDVMSYEVSIKVNPISKSITGTTVMRAKIVIPTNVIALDLDAPYKLTEKLPGLLGDPRSKEYWLERKENKILVHFFMTKQPGDLITTMIQYEGTPRIAPNPPWVGGFMWTKTPSGADWISVALQNDGADLLFPCKDHPSDKPATASMHITVPNPLVVSGPGRLDGVTKHADGTSTYSWRMTNPIANYSLVFNVAPYKIIRDTVKSVTGRPIPIVFYILPENYDKGAKLIAETKKYNAFFEKYLGPFPFRSIKLGIVETPHLGMEHSTNIAYGNKYRFEPDGFDWLMFHEYGHEWWANLVTASDWRDFWIHEGFQSFMDTLWVEESKGKDAYFTAMKNRARGFRNKQPVAPREAKFAHEVYLSAPDYKASDGDIYGKGAYVLHTLRYLIGDEAFFKALRHMAYPTKQMETYTDGRQQRLVNTDDFRTIAEADSGMELDWFFELYLRQPKLPKLVSETRGNVLNLRWETPGEMPFPMPVDVVINGKTQRVAMPNGRGSVTFTGSVPVVDPNGWVLRAQ